MSETVVDSCVLAHIDRTCPCCGERMVIKAYISLFREFKMRSVCCAQPVSMMVNNGRVLVKFPLKRGMKHKSKHNILMGNHY